ncbi:MAG: NAD-dependent epimerase/dehydratase family protein [Lentisphaerae bacterium]|nr:NAD-dependent epimerase/dehydratase family protein [Lentisphaerota bacterium]MBT4815255.1 NAD-dependent epimerase/dehydratase family protein [Lentisphaerota bacterium]MBT5608802.1 NAD-dependent epimerase/dehydratase family protein [Lentisphaerota bacterium]MBT7058313.1 NAD-dependent epimerase/dehydratase family protein [Lentisphaerota bacterium]MBT7840288.1 NAD-dependent epimerase/dehydratase family protein [Lentisphaerota bacterium]
MRVLVTGGAGFVGSRLCRLFRADFPKADIVAFDNLRRRGSELNVAEFPVHSIQFVHGDVRSSADLAALDGHFDVVVEASAEPSVHAGTGGESPRYVIDTNFGGTINCLEFARVRAGGMVFLSTSRVYAVSALRQIRLREEATRLVPEDDDQPPGFMEGGVTEAFPTVGRGSRSLYGTTKLASELFIEEYVAGYDFPAVINRCGVIAGAGQFGKVDQGVFTLWVARHLFGGGLRYTGFGGTGKQVRDLLHPRDLYALIRRQVDCLGDIRGEVFGVGGGVSGAVSLAEYTTLCQDATGMELPIGSVPDTSAVDIPHYVTNTRKVSGALGWRPQISPAEIVGEISTWLQENSEQLKPLFAPGA